jgi:hypothetical protein
MDADARLVSTKHYCAIKTVCTSADQHRLTLTGSNVSSLRHDHPDPLIVIPSDRRLPSWCCGFVSYESAPDSSNRHHPIEATRYRTAFRTTGLQTHPVPLLKPLPRLRLKLACLIGLPLRLSAVSIMPECLVRTLNQLRIIQPRLLWIIQQRQASGHSPPC